MIRYASSFVTKRPSFEGKLTNADKHRTRHRPVFYRVTDQTGISLSFFSGIDYTSDLECELIVQT
jgi:hypothetical protein